MYSLSIYVYLDLIIVLESFRLFGLTNFVRPNIILVLQVLVQVWYKPSSKAKLSQ